MGSKRQLGIAPLIVVILIAVIGIVFFLTKQKLSPQGSPKQQNNFEVIVKENPNDETKSDVYLKDTSGQETFFITLAEVYKNHYHSSEYHNGNLYIIRRTGGEEGYQDIPDWTDNLWKYDSNKQGKKIYGNRGLDFRVSDNGELIAIVGSEADNSQNAVFINNDGKELAKFTAEDLEVDYIDPLVWGDDSFWLAEKALPVPTSFIKIDREDFTVSKFSIEVDDVGPEYTLNPNTQKLAYSDYPPLFDTDSIEEFEKSGKKTTLKVYDLVSDEVEVITTSVTKKFNPEWIDNNTLEYDNPTGEGRITKKI